MPRGEPDTDELLDRSAAGDASARGALLLRHRRRLRRMVAIRLDRRLAPRVDPSDVVQDALAEAAGKLDNYLIARPLPFYPWLRQIAWENVIRLHRRHVGAARRSVKREEPPPLPDRSALELAERLFAAGTCPSSAAQKAEFRARVREAVAELADSDREILALRHLEQLSVAETAGVLGISESAVKMRHVRALARLRSLLGDLSGGGQ